MHENNMKDNPKMTTLGSKMSVVIRKYASYKGPTPSSSRISDGSIDMSDIPKNK